MTIIKGHRKSIHPHLDTPILFLTNTLTFSPSHSQVTPHSHLSHTTFLSCQGKKERNFLPERNESEASLPVLVVFYFCFFTKIYFYFRNLQEYTPAGPLPGGRDLVAPLRGGRGFFVKILRNFLQKSPWRTGRPAAGRPAPQAAQQRGGGPRPPGSRAADSPILI